MKTAFQDDLTKEEITPLHLELLTLGLKYADASRREMCKHYDTWDTNQASYQAYLTSTEADKQAIKDGKPVSQRVPLIYSKVDAFRAHLNALFSQRKKFYEFTPVSENDVEIVDPIETVLEVDVQHNDWPLKTRQVNTDIARFGLAVIYDEWEEKRAYIPETKERSLLGFKLGDVTTFREVLTHQGNKVCIVSPYSFLPDTRLPFSRLQDGDFCGSESEMTKISLTALEQQDVVSGIEHLKNMGTTRRTARKGSSRSATFDFNKDQIEDSDVYVVTDLYIKLVPADFMADGGQPLGNQKHPVMFRMWIVNDMRIVRMEIVGNYHQEFPYSVPQFDPDDQSCIGKSLIERIDKLQELSDWIINARIASVKRSIDSKLVVDPAGIDVDSLKEDSKIILTRRGAGMRGLNNLIQQFDVTDTTQGHLADNQQVQDMTNQVSGITENSQGNASKGRRSATEMRAVNSGGHSRLNSLGECVWLSWKQTGNRMTSNLRQGMAKDYLQSIIEAEEEKLEELFVKFQSDAATIARSTDLFVYDGMLPTDKMYLSQSLQEILTLLLQNPDSQVTFDISPKLLLNYIMELRGVKGLKSVSLQNDPKALQQLIQQIVEQALAQQAEEFKVIAEKLQSQIPAPKYR